MGFSIYLPRYRRRLFRNQLVFEPSEDIEAEFRTNVDIAAFKKEGPCSSYLVSSGMHIS